MVGSRVGPRVRHSRRQLSPFLRLTGRGVDGGNKAEDGEAHLKTQPYLINAIACGI